MTATADADLAPTNRLPVRPKRPRVWAFGCLHAARAMSRGPADVILNPRAWPGPWIPRHKNWRRTHEAHKKSGKIPLIKPDPTWRSADPEPDPARKATSVAVIPLEAGFGPDAAARGLSRVLNVLIASGRASRSSGARRTGVLHEFSVGSRRSARTVNRTDVLNLGRRSRYEIRAPPSACHARGPSAPRSHAP